VFEYSNVHIIPVILPATIPMIRTISAQLFDIVPHCSQKLSELSVHLGSIVLDSAALTKARFDFRQSNEESSIMLNEVKLMVDCKINKQYIPQIDALLLLGMVMKHRFSFGIVLRKANQDSMVCLLHQLHKASNLFLFD